MSFRFTNLPDTPVECVSVVARPSNPRQCAVVFPVEMDGYSVLIDHGSALGQKISVPSVDLCTVVMYTREMGIMGDPNVCCLSVVLQASDNLCYLLTQTCLPDSLPDLNEIIMNDTFDLEPIFMYTDSVSYQLATEVWGGE